MDPDLELLEAVKAGDDSAFEKLMDRHKESIFRFIYRFTQNESIAADLAEETFVKVYFNAHRFKPKAKVTTWIFTIALNLCRDYQRKQSRRNFYSLDKKLDNLDNKPLIDTISSEKINPLEETVKQETLKAVREAIEKLPRKLKVALILFAIEGRPHKECASLLNCSVKTVETRIYRAKKILRKTLNKYQN